MNWAKKAANKPIPIVYHAQNESSIQCTRARIAAIRTPSCSAKPSAVLCGTTDAVVQLAAKNGPAAHARAPPAPDARSADGRRRPRLWPRERPAWLPDREPRNRLDRRREDAGRATYPELRGHARHGHLCRVGAGRGRRRPRCLQGCRERRMEPVHRRCPVTRVAAMAFGAARTPSTRRSDAGTSATSSARRSRRGCCMILPPTFMEGRCV